MILKAAIKRKQGAIPIATEPFTKVHGLATFVMDTGGWTGVMERVTLGHGSLAMQAETEPSSTVWETSMSAASKCLWPTGTAPTQILWEPSTKESGDMTCSMAVE